MFARCIIVVPATMVASIASSSADLEATSLYLNIVQLLSLTAVLDLVPLSQLAWQIAPTNSKLSHSTPFILLVSFLVIQFCALGWFRQTVRIALKCFLVVRCKRLVWIGPLAFWLLIKVLGL